MKSDAANGATANNMRSSAAYGNSQASMSSNFTRAMDDTKELAGSSQMILPAGSEGVGGQSIFEPSTKQKLNELSDLYGGNSTLNDRETSSQASATYEKNKPLQGSLTQPPQDSGFYPAYGHLWRDADGDYSSEDEEDKNNADAAILNKIRVVIRVRPLI